MAGKEEKTLGKRCEIHEAGRCRPEDPVKKPYLFVMTIEESQWKSMEQPIKTRRACIQSHLVAALPLDDEDRRKFWLISPPAHLEGKLLNRLNTNVRMARRELHVINAGLPNSWVQSDSRGPAPSWIHRAGCEVASSRVHEGRRGQHHFENHSVAGL